MIQHLDQEKETQPPVEPGVSAADLREQLHSFAEMLKE